MINVSEDNIAYVIQESVDGPLMLCVMDRARETFHTFTLPLVVAARLAAECSAVVNSAMQK